jgi:transcriptional regulator with XRE-family HTH domain
MTELSIAERLRQYIESELHMTPNAFAISTGIDRANLSKMLNGSQPITKKTLYKIVDTYDVRLDWLVSGTGAIRKGEPQNLCEQSNQSEVSDYTTSYSSNGLSARLVDEIADTRKLLAEQLREHNKQFDRLLTIIENLQK